MSEQIPAECDVAIVGGGHNGLVCAFYLAKAGRGVHLFEKSSTVGGACITEELIPGARFSTCANVLWNLQPKVEDDLELHRHGLRYEPFGYRIALFPENERIVYSVDGGETAAEVARLNPNDAKRVDDWYDFWHRAASIIHPFFLRDAPSTDQLAIHAERSGNRDVFDALLTKTTRQLADEYFEDERVKASLTHGEDVGFWEEQSPFLEAWFQTDIFTRPGAQHGVYVRGGMGEVTQAMRRAAEEAGASVHTDQPVSKILREGNTAVGIELADGTRVAARAVVSNADPKRTFGELLGDAETVRTNEWTTDISYQKFHAVVSELPDLRAYFNGEQPEPRRSSLLRIAPSMQLNREALAAAREGELPEVPFIGGIFIPSVFDPSLAPVGHHTLSAWIGYAPGRLAHGSWDAARDEAAKRFIDRVGEFIPNFARSLVDWKMLLAVDIEARTSLTDGNIRHLDVVPGQYWDDRPAKGWGQRTPIEGLYLCGVGTHPGGEVTGAPGFNAARAIREDEEVGANEVGAGDPLLVSMG